MVRLTKAFIIICMAIAPAFAAPIQFDDVELMARDPSFWGSIRNDFKRVGRVVKSVVKKVAPFASMVPGPIGIAGSVASAVIRRDVEEALFIRAVQDELNARDYGNQLETREIEDLDAL